MHTHQQSYTNAGVLYYTMEKLHPTYAYSWFSLSKERLPLQIYFAHYAFVCTGDMGVGKSCLLHQFTEKKCKVQYFLCQCDFNNSKRNPHTFSMLVLYGYCWREVLPPSHGRLPTHHWSGVWDENSGSLWPEDQAADLGHCRPGKISVHYLTQSYQDCFV